jgi:hypothetical protein
LVADKLVGLAERQKEREALRRRHQINSTLSQMRKEGEFGTLEGAKLRMDERRVPYEIVSAFGTTAIRAATGFMVYFDPRTGGAIGHERARRMMKSRQDKRQASLLEFPAT